MLDNLVTTVQALAAGRWQPTPPVCFGVSRPKAREIHAPAYADRVVHHWLVPRLEAVYEPVFIHDVYSNRRGKGIHAAVDRLQGFMRALHTGRQASGFYLQLDIANFFNSIDRPLLFALLQHRLRKGVRAGRVEAEAACLLRDVSHRILRQDVGRVARPIGDRRLLARIPAHKRLLHAGADKGLPIGNLTSQFFANVYLNELDQFIKHTLKCRYYLRYVDDFLLLHASEAQLRQWEGQISDFLAERLHLRLRTPSVLRPCADGADFLGYIVRPWYRLVRRRVVGNCRERLDGFARELLGRASGGRRLLRLPACRRQRLQAVVASYLGHFAHAHSERLVGSLLRRYPWLGLLFRQHHQRLLPLWQPGRVSGYRSQVAWFRRCFPCARLEVQRGTETDVFPPSGRIRQGQAATIRHLARVVRVREEGFLKGGLKRRVLAAVVFADPPPPSAAMNDQTTTHGPAPGRKHP